MRLILNLLARHASQLSGVAGGYFFRPSSPTRCRRANNEKEKIFSFLFQLY